MNSEIEVTKSNKFSEFLSLINFNSISFKKKNDPKENLIKIADELLLSGNVKAFFGMAVHGYSATPKQQKTIDSFIDNAFSKPLNDPYEYPQDEQDLCLYLEEQLAKGYKLNNENAISFLINHDYSKIYGDGGALHNSEGFLKDPNYVLSVSANIGEGKSSNYKLPFLTEQLRNIMAKEDFSKELFQDFKKFLKTKSVSKEKNVYFLSMRKYGIIFAHAPKLFLNGVPSEEFLEITTKFKKNGIHPSYIELLTNAYNTVYTDHLNNIFAETKLTYSEDLIKTLTFENIKTQLTIDKDIPKNALNIIKEVENVYRKIKQHTTLDNHLDEITQLELILEKRIPEVLTKFLTIDPSYRTSLVSSQGKNAEQLMLESLDNLKQSFNSVYENMNQNSVNSLSATNRYTKSIKM